MNASLRADTGEVVKYDGLWESAAKYAQKIRAEGGVTMPAYLLLDMHKKGREPSRGEGGGADCYEKTVSCDLEAAPCKASSCIKNAIVGDARATCIHTFSNEHRPA